MARLHGANRKPNHRERGAAAVEFAVGAMLLVTMAFGAAEFGLLLSAKHDLNGAARLAGRVAATPCGEKDATTNAPVADPDSEPPACVQGNRQTDDFDILRAVESSLGSMNEVEKVVIYKVISGASRGSGAPDPNCLNTDIGREGYCNVYTDATPLLSEGGVATGDPLLTNLGDFFNSNQARNHKLLKKNFNCTAGPSAPFCPTKITEVPDPDPTKPARKIVNRSRNLQQPTLVGVYVKTRYTSVTKIVQQDRTLAEWSMVQLEPHSLARDEDPPCTTCSTTIDISVSVNDATVNEGAGTVTLSLSMTGAISTGATRVTLTTSNGTAANPALAGSDYTSTSVQAVFAAGATTTTVTVPILNDNQYEPTETFRVTLTNPTNGVKLRGDLLAVPGPTTATVTITDDDPKPKIRVFPANGTEGNGPINNKLQFNITMDASSTTETVTFTTSSGTTSNGAISGADFLPTPTASQTVTFNAGDTTKQVFVEIIGDVIDEPNETFNVQLISPSAGIDWAGSTTSAIGTIEDDDDGPIASVIPPSPNFVVEGGLLRFKIRLSSKSSVDQTVTYSTENGTALAPGDYVPDLNNTIVIPAGSDEIDVVVVTNDDTTDEDDSVDETVRVRITSVSSGMTIGTASAEGQIKDNDSAPTIAVSSASAKEAAGKIEFLLELSAPSATPQTVQFSTSTRGSGSGFATLGSGSPSDAAQLSNQTVTIPANTKSIKVPVTVYDDTTVEPNETFNVTISGWSGGIAATGNTTSAIGTIENDDFDKGVVTLTGPTTANEGDTLNFTLNISPGYPTAQTVTIEIINGTATLGLDFSATGFSGTTKTINVPANATVVNGEITIPIIDDALFEGNENFTVRIKAVSAQLTIGSASSRVVTITDNDTRPTISVGDTSVEEGDSVQVRVYLSNPSTQPITVTFSTNAGRAPSATATTDYTSVSQTVTFNPNDLEKFITVSTREDILVEGTEYIGTTLTGATNVAASGNKLTGTIDLLDDEPTISVSSPTVGEGGTLNFAVTLSRATSQSITVTLTTANGPTGTGGAVAPGDYTARSAVTVTIPAGSTSATVSVVTLDDAIEESTEIMYLRINQSLSTLQTLGVNPVGSTVQGTGTITDNDAVIAWTVNNRTINEGSSGSFTITLASPALKDMVFSGTTGNGGGGTPATSGADYTAVTAKTCTIKAGSSTCTISVTTLQDSAFEGNETFLLNVTHNGVTKSGTGTIRDDDTKPSVSVNSASATEGGSMTFTVTLSGPVTSAQTVTFATSSGTATETNDYTGQNVTLTFNPGDPLTKTITIVTKQDTIDEGTETFNVTLSGNSAGIDMGTSTGTGTILDNDQVIRKISISDTVVSEGAGTATFTVTLDAASTSDQSFKYTTSDGSALAGSDYTSTANTVTIPAGTKTLSVTVPVLQDNIDEPSETFTVDLSNLTSGLVALDINATGTITDDDNAPAVSVSSATVTEGAGVQATFTVSLNRPSSTAQSVTFSTGNNAAGASAPGDFVAKTVTVNFAAGETSKTVVVDIVNDNTPESTETFPVSLSNLSSGLINGAITNTGTINDDDSGFLQKTVTISGVGAAEGGQARFTIRLSGASATIQTVTFATANGTATEPSDYSSKVVTLDFAPGVTQQDVYVDLIDDNVDEPNETFSGQVTAVSAGLTKSGTPTATVTITDGDPTPTVSITDSKTVIEGQIAVLTISLSNPSSVAQSVKFSTGGGSASAGSDYTAITDQVVTFAPGETSKTVSIVTTDDSSVESSEDVGYSITISTSGITSGSPMNGTVTITDNEMPPTTRRSGGGTT